MPGIRYDRNKEFGHQWSPKAAVNYRADDRTKIFASWGRVYRAPTTAELYMVDENGIHDYYGNKYVLANGGENELKPEKGHTEIIGFEHDFDKTSVLTGSFFYSKMKNALYWNSFYLPYFDDNDNFTGYGLVSFPTNNETQKKHGFELSFEKKINDNVSFDIGYSHTKVKNEIMVSNYMQPNGYRLGVHYQNKNFKANLMGIMVTGLDEDTYVSKNYAVLDFNTSYKINDTATVYFRALNFTDKNYSAIGQNYPMPGRFLQAGAQFKF